MIKPIAGLVLGLCFGSVAQAMTCPSPTPYPPACPHGHYPFVIDRCGPRVCGIPAYPPPLPNVHCTYVGSGYDCAVWPRGADVSYSYSASGPVQVSDTGPTYQSNVWVQCQSPVRPGGVLAVTAYSPFGLASQTKTIALSCRDTPQH
jgi:hypothetical protein